jgi:NAD(P)-dependent dehydrogenase (short-subunit alcohol dehydrogenase family)
MKQHAVIFGGSSGIGFSLAARLIKDEYNVTIVSRDKKKLEAAGEKLNNEVSFYSVDANNEEEIIKFSDNIKDIDHLIISVRGEVLSVPFAESNTAEVRKAFDEKFWTQYNIVHHCLKKIKPNGSIILTSGIASQRSYPGFYWHSCANAAIEALAKSLCTEILPVRINVVCPGFTERKPDDNERLKNILKIEPKLPLNRLASQEEIVEAYLFLIRSSYSTGTTLIIDGGVLNV